MGLVAPHFFRALYELPLGLIACGLLTLIVLSGDPDDGLVPAVAAAALDRRCRAAAGAGGYLGYEWRGTLLDTGNRIAGLLVKNWSAAREVSGIPADGRAGGALPRC